MHGSYYSKNYVNEEEERKRRYRASVMKSSAIKANPRTQDRSARLEDEDRKIQGRPDEIQIDTRTNRNLAS